MSPQFRMPAEWEPQERTYIAWPSPADDDHGLFLSISWSFLELVRLLSFYQPVEILCATTQVADELRRLFSGLGVSLDRIRLHVVPHRHWWIRDTGPTGVLNKSQEVQWIVWGFDGWGRHQGVQREPELPGHIASISKREAVPGLCPRTDIRLNLEGGMFDTNGEGTLLVTEQCLLSKEQNRNADYTKADYEQLFRRYFGVAQVLWLPCGLSGDQTNGHVDQVARFVGSNQIMVAVEDDREDPDFPRLQENLHYLELATNHTGQSFELLVVSNPKRIHLEGELLPASYVNFYIGNGVVLVPTYNDKNDLPALEAMQKAFPSRDTIGLYARDFLLGGGSLHCITLPQPAAV